MPGVPRRASSIGIVMSSSISADVMPFPSVCTSTLGGANSGKTSTGMRRSSSGPKTSSAAYAGRTRKRNLRLERTSQANTGALAYDFFVARALQ